MALFGLAFIWALIQAAILSMRGEVNPDDSVFLMPDSDGWVYPAVMDNQPTRPNIRASDVKFYLWTRQNMIIARQLRNRVNFTQSTGYSPDKPTKIFIHGFGQHAFSDFVTRARDAYLSVGDYNIISVDWNRLARSPYYLTASKNTREIGIHTAAFLDFLIEQGTKVDHFHVIGFSLGAHVAGWVGHTMTKGILPRITALDPAYPGFDKEERRSLSAKDAAFVDVIHTNARVNKNKGFGVFTPLGHADFYPNGGSTQPGCNDFFQTHRKGCNHRRSTRLFIESILGNDKFLSIPCSSYLEFLRGSCGDCSKVKCVSMGEYVSTEARGTYYLNTHASSPYSYD